MMIWPLSSGNLTPVGQRDVLATAASLPFIDIRSVGTVDVFGNAAKGIFTRRSSPGIRLFCK